MGVADKMYPAVVTALRNLRGDGPLSPRGDRLPLTTAVDTILVTSQFAPLLIAALQRFNAQNFGDGQRDKMWPSVSIDDGEYAPSLIGAPDPITVKAYVANYGDRLLPYRRSATKGGRTYEPSITGSASGDPGALAQVRQAMREWEAVIQISTSIIGVWGANLSAIISVEETQNFWRAIRMLCYSLDSINAIVPPDVTARIVEGLKVATERTGEIAGAAAAHVAEAVGRTAGSAISGFTDTAGLTSMLVAGVILFVMIG